MADIIISDLRPRTQILQTVESLAQNKYDFGFPILAKADLKVAVDDTVIDPSEYNLVGEGSATGGYIEFITLEPAVGSRITLWRDMPFERTTDFAPGADLRAAVLNDELDRTALLLQQAEALVGDSLHRRPYDLDQELILPTVTERAGKYLSFDANGVPEAINARILGDIGNLALIYQGPLDTSPTQRLDGSALRDGDLYFDTVAGKLRSYSNGAWADTTTLAPSPFMSGLLVDADAAAARSTLGLGTAAALDAGTNPNNAVQLDGSGRLPAVDGSTLTGIARSDAFARDIATLNAWEIASLNTTTAATLVNTFLDAFGDDSGIDPSSFGQSFNFLSEATIGTADLVPEMTSNTTPSGEITGSVAGSNSTVANLYRLFDGSATALEATALTATYDFGSARSIGGYTIQVAGEGLSRYATAWTISGSNDNATWTVMDTQTGQSWTDLESRTFTCATPGTWRYISFQLDGYSGTFAQIMDIQYHASVARPMTVDLTGGIAVYSSTGAAQNFTVPLGVTSISAKAWGAGGGADLDHGALGGGGGYATATIPVTPQESLAVVVGTGGGTGEIAGGGGGAGDSAGAGGPGGGASGGSGTGTGFATGGTSSTGGTAGSQGQAGSALSGGNGRGGNASAGGTGGWPNGGNGGGQYAVTGGGGGGGYFGGGGVGPTQGGGGGGSGFSEGANTGATLTAGSGTTPGNAGDSDRSGAGTGGASAGQRGADGRLIIQHNGAGQLVSVAATASTAPSELRTLFEIEETEAVTENTDFIGYVSRDDGGTWTAVTLTRVAGDGTRGVYAGTGDVSAQPIGVAARMKFTVAAGKSLRLHRWAMQADTQLTI